MANNPTVIAATLDDSELKKSIQQLVNNVTTATDKIKKSFDDTVTHIRQSFSSLKDVKIDIGGIEAAAKQRQLKQAVKETAMSYDQLLGAMQLAQRRIDLFHAKKFVTTEDIDKYVASVERASAIQEKLNEKTRELALLRAKQNESSWGFDVRANIRSLDAVDERLKQLNRWYKELETQSERQAKSAQAAADKRAKALEKEQAQQEKILEKQKAAVDKYQTTQLQNAFKGAMSMPAGNLDQMASKLERIKTLTTNLSKIGILSETQINRATTAMAKLEERIAKINAENEKSRAQKTKEEAINAEKAAKSYDALANAKAKASAPTGTYDTTILRQYDEQIQHLKRRLAEVNEEIKIYIQLINSGQAGSASGVNQEIKKITQEAEQLMATIHKLEGQRGNLVDVLNPGDSFKNYMDSLKKTNPELAALNDMYRRGETLLTSQLTTQKQQTSELEKQKQLQQSNEIKRQFDSAMGMKPDENSIYQLQQKLTAIQDVLVKVNGTNILSPEKLKEAEAELDRLNVQITKLFKAEDASNTSASGAIKKKTIEYKSLADMIAKTLHISDDNVKTVNLQFSSYNKLSAALKQAQNAFSSLNSRERSSEMGQSLLNYINRLKTAIRDIQSSMNRPASLRSALGLEEDTIDKITYKIQQLNAYKRGLNLGDPKQAAEIKTVDNEINRLNTDLNKYISTTQRVSQANNALTRSWNYMKNRLAFYFTVGASTQFVKNLIDVRSQYEMTERSLGILINSAEQGTKIFNELSTMALVSPYTLIELSNAAKQLVAYDIAASDVVDTTRRLADMAAAVGIPMERLTYALGQIKAYGYLNSRDNRMFANAGIPLVRQLADYYSELQGRIVSTADVYDMIKKKAVNFKDVMAVINKMTDEGGKFFDFQAKMAGTLKVQLANLTLAWNNMLNDIGKSNQTLITAPIKGLKELFLHWNEINRVVTSMVEALVATKIAQIITLKTTTNLTSGLIAQRVVGEKLTKTLVGVRSSFVALATNPITWVFVIISAFADMINTIVDAHDAMKAFNASIRDAGKERFENVSKFLDEYKTLYKQLYEWQKNADGTSSRKYNYVVQDASGRKYTDYVTSNVSEGEARKAWVAMEEEIKNTASASDFFIRKLNEIEDINDRLRAGFDYLGDIQRVAGAMQEVGDDTIRMTKNYSAWWNMYKAPEGVIENLKDYQKEVDGTATAWDKLVKVSGETNIFSAISYALNMQEEDLERFRKDLEKTTESILNFASMKGFNPTQEREFLAKISEQTIQEANLQPKEALTYRLNLEKQYVDTRKQYYDEELEYELSRAQLAADEKTRVEGQQRYNQLKAEKENFEKSFGEGEIIWDEFTKFMVRNHSYALQQMFGNMTREEIEHIDWSDPKWKKWAEDNAASFSRQYGYSFDKLRQLVNDANRWSIFLKLIISTEGQSEYYNQLSQYDQLVDTAESHIDRLQKRIDQLNKKQKQGTISAKETIELNGLILEQQGEINDRNYATERGGISKKQEKEAKKAEKAATAAARKRDAEARKAQKQAETELQKAFKDELQLIDKVRSQYKKLTDAGVTHTVALTMVTNQFGNSISNINKILGKNGLPLFDISTFSGTEDPNKLLELLNKQLRAAKAAKNVKPVEIKDLEIKIGEVTVDAKTYNMKKVTDGLNNELSKIKDEYELAVELDANPELGNFLENMFDFDTTTFPKSIDEYMWNVQDAFEKAVDDMKLDEKGKFFDVFTANEADWKQWAESVGMSEEALKDFSAKFIESKGVAEKWARDIIKQTQDLEYKLADNNGKIAIEEEKLANLRKQLANEVNEEQRHLLELQIQDQENAIARLKDEAVSTLSTYKNLFNSIVEHSARVTRMLAQQWKGALENAVKNADNTYTITDPNSGETSTVSEEKYNKLLNQVNGKLRDTQTSFDKIKEALTKGEDKLVDWVKAVELIAEEAHKISDGIGEIANIADALGADEDVTEVINDIAASVDGLATAAQGAAQIANGDIIGGTVNVMKGLWSTVSSWFDNSDKKITKKVEKSEREVKRLENAYKNLEYAVEHSMGTAETQARRAAIANKQLQLVELERQLTLEKSRKKKNQDQDKIQELEGAVIDAKNELKDLKEDVMNTLLGSDIKSAAEEFVDTWVQAWKEGETTLDAINEKMDDMIFNLIKKAATSKIVGTILKPLYDAVDYYSSSESEGGVEFTTNEMKALADLSKQLGVDINTALGAFYGNLENLDVISKDIKSSELSALQQGIQGITEDTASALEAYMNSVSQQVYLHSDLLTQIRDAVVALDGDVQMSVQGQMLLQLQQSYQVQMAIQTIMVGWSNPSGSAVKVELLN